MTRAPDNEGCFPMSQRGDTTPLDAVRAELDAIEAHAREVGDLTAGLRARLTPEDFRLVWALRDAVERLALAEGLLRDRWLADELARHLPASSPALRVIQRRLLADELAVDGPD
jgi:hypothetical protein